MAKADHIRSQLRIPIDLYERVNRAAEASGRSMNAEIVYRLTESFDSEDLIAVADGISRLQQKHEADPDFWDHLKKTLTDVATKTAANADGTQANVGEVVQRIKKKRGSS